MIDHGTGPAKTGRAVWVNRLFTREGSTPEYQELITLHRKLLDRINLEALSSMAGERVRAGNSGCRRQAGEEEKRLSAW